MQEGEEEWAGTEKMLRRRALPEGHYPQSRRRETVTSLLSSAIIASSSSWDSFWRCWIPAPTGSRSLSDSLGEQRGSVEE